MIRLRLTAFVRLAAVLAGGTALVLSAGVAAPTDAGASGPTLTGAGSTWAQIAIDQWAADAARFGVSINYQGNGSTAGRQMYIQNVVDFAASEIPFLPNEVAQLRSEHKSYQYLPDVAGGTAIMYNLKTTSGQQVRNLKLSAGTIAKIFTGGISNWDDPAIRADNPGLSLPNEPLTPVIRADGSGTSAKLAAYLAYEDPAVWNPFAAKYNVPNPVQFWPNFPRAVAVTGSDGMANYISNPSVGNGAIGYVEAGYVYEHDFVPAYLKNRAGDYAAPTSENDAIALHHVTLNPDLTENLIGVYNAPESDAYPLASYSYLITQTTGFNPAKGYELGKWIIYIACAGQREAAPLGYSPLPPNLVKDDFAAEQRIPGAPKPPPLTPSGCPNPTITGAGYGGGPSGGGGSTLPPSGGSGNGGTTSAGGGHGGKKHHHHHSQTGTDPVVAQSTGNSSAGSGISLLSASDRQAGFKAAVEEADHSGGSASPSLGTAGLLAAILLLPLAAFGRKGRRS